MNSLNKVILIGNIGKDPEVRHLEDGATIAKFPLATTETYNDKTGAKITQTEWHNIVLWRGLAEVAEKYLRKGKQVYIEGKLKTRSWEDKDGNKRYITEIIGDNLIMLGRKSDENQLIEDQNTDNKDKNTSTKVMEDQANDVLPESTEEDDLPF